jgi:hypothetical protein
MAGVTSNKSAPDRRNYRLDGGLPPHDRRYSRVVLLKLNKGATL